MPHVVHITTVPDSLLFISELVDFLTGKGWQVTVVSSGGRHLEAFARDHAVRTVSVEMSRAVTPLRDLDALARLTDLLVDLEPDIVHSHTPKGGLLGMLASTTAQVPARIYQMRGLVTLTAGGALGRVLRVAEQTSCMLADHVICQSPSLREVAIESGLVDAAHSSVLAHGGNGIDATGRFDPCKTTGLAVRPQFGIPDGAPVIGFVGRLVRDKGIVELEQAWREIRRDVPEAHFLMLGQFEERDAVPPEVRERLLQDERAHLVGFVRDTPRYYEAMDFLVLPSHREGLPNVPLEAAAMAVPTITTDAVGCVDAVVDNVTGLRVGVGRVDELAAAMKLYLEDGDLVRRHGDNARARVLRDFQPGPIHEATLALYERLRRN